MRTRNLTRLAGLLAACLLLGGCGPITAQSLLMKGAMWAGKEVVKKEYKKYKERKHEGESATHSRHSRSSHRQGPASRPVRE